MKICYLPQRKVLRVTGKDSTQLLQNLLTCDLKKLDTQKALYGALLTPNGRFLLDVFIVKEGKDLLLDVFDQESFIRKFNLYKLNFESYIESVSSLVYALWGDFNDELMDKAIFFEDPRLGVLGRRAISINPLQQNTELQDYETYRIKNGVPEMPKDLIPEKSIILECNLHHFNAISFDKGCYIGQELIARTYHTGQLRKCLLPLKILEGVVKSEDEIFFKDKKIGKICSVSENWSLGMIRFSNFKEELNGLIVRTKSDSMLLLHLPSWFSL